MQVSSMNMVIFILPNDNTNISSRHANVTIVTTSKDWEENKHVVAPKQQDLVPLAPSF
jgi:hypothetical protein